MKNIFLVTLFLIVSHKTSAQAKGTRVGYIDMEYILGKLPNYQESLNSLEQKASDWKGEIDKKNAAIKLLKDALNTERVLLTKDLILEREEEIKFLEDDLVDYQQKKFGPEGDLIIMRSSLVKPVQDMVFNIIQDISEKRNYDFILDKSSDLTVLFAKKNLDLSDFVVRAINRALKGEKISKKELEKIEKEEEDGLNVKSSKKEEREKILEEKRQKMLKDKEERNATIAAKKAEALAKKNEKNTSRKPDGNQDNGEVKNKEQLNTERGEKNSELENIPKTLNKNQSKDITNTILSESENASESNKLNSGTNIENTNKADEIKTETTQERKKRILDERLNKIRADKEKRNQEALLRKSKNN